MKLWKIGRKSSIGSNESNIWFSIQSRGNLKQGSQMTWSCMFDAPPTNSLFLRHTNSFVFSKTFSPSLFYWRPFSFWPGVDFLKVGRKAQIIKIALSICALPQHPTFWEAFYWPKGWARGRRAQKQFMKSTPAKHNNFTT